MQKDIDSGFLREVERLATENKIEILLDDRGRQYFTNSVSAVKQPRADKLQLSTLDGLVDMINAEGLECGIYVSGPNKVYLRTKLDEKWRERETFAVSISDSCDFPFSREMLIEEFIIKLQCAFVDTEEKKRLISLVSSITAAEVTTADDDGLAQEVVTKSSIGHKKAQLLIDPIVSLQPYRTFPEIDQPASQFLLRMHQREKGQLPNVSLREAGGHMWKVTAVQSIYEYLNERAPEGIPIIR